MFRTIWLVVAVLSSMTALHGETKWIRMQSGDFQIYSQANERETRAALNYFERVRSFFEQKTGHSMTNPLPVYIVLFNSAKEYEPYKFNDFAIAYYASRSDRDYIVMGKTGEQTAQAATHEYVHMVARHGGLDLPPWLGEGMAEFYSTLHPIGDSIELGGAILGRIQAMLQEKWVPLATILTADRDSPYYNESKKAGNLYNESWGLVQFLSTSKEYGPGFDRLFSAVAAGTPSIEALEKIYGRPLSKIEEDLKFYLSSGSYVRLVGKMKLNVTDKIAAEPANMYDVRLALANLSAKDSQSRLEELSREDPKRPESWAGLGYLAWRDRETKQAVEHFAKAFELGDHSPKLLWDFGRLALREHPEDGIRALSELVKLEPDNMEARIELASAHMNMRQPGQALSAATPAKPGTKVTPQQAERLFYLMASAQIQLGDRVVARTTALRLQSEARSQEYKDRAASMLRYLDQADEAERSGRRASLLAPPPATPVELRVQAEAGEEERRPVTLRRREEPPQASAQGRIVAMECGTAPRITLETDQGRKIFVALDPNRIVVSGTQPTAEGIPCGPQQKPIPIRILFDSVPAGVTGDGVVREMHFQ